ENDASLLHPLILAGGVVLGVLAKVAHRPRRRNALGDLDHVLFQSVDIALELLVLFLRHRHAFGRHGYSRSTRLRQDRRFASVLLSVSRTPAKHRSGVPPRWEGHPLC